MANPIPAAIYARYSSDKQDDRSLEVQERNCRRFAASRIADGARYAIVDVLTDAGISGATLDRPGLCRLLEGCRRGIYRAAFVDDPSRLSRDLSDTLNLGKKFAAWDVELIACDTGLSSRDESAEDLTVINGLVASKYLKNLRYKTHGGLEKRAIDGFWTGGRVFGYSTIPEPNPPDLEHVRKVPVINEAEAAIVRRIFRLYAGGTAPKAIARLLNAEGIAAPYDDAYAKAAGKGWGHTTIRAMLRNDRYLGKLTWNRRTWFRDPETKRYRSRPRPEKEWIVQNRPDLRIIDDALWTKVQARFPEQRKRGTPRTREGYQTAALSGLLVCGSCGSRMSLAGNGKGNPDYRSFACSAHRSEKNCSSGLQISERKVTTALEETLRASFDHPAFRSSLDAEISRLVAAEKRKRAAESRDPSEAEIRKMEGRVARLVEAIASGGGGSAALGAKLREEERRLEALRAARRPAVAPRPPFAGPGPEELAKLWEDVAGTLLSDRKAAREELSALLSPVILTKTESGTILMRTEVDLDALQGLRRAVRAKVSCGGRI